MTLPHLQKFVDKRDQQQQSEEDNCGVSFDPAHQEASQEIGRAHRNCAQGVAECTVIPPGDR
jgi:hypothetical protein